MDNANDGDFEGVEQIYKTYTDKRKQLLTFSNKEQATALHLAAKNGHSEIVNFLVDAIVTDFPNKKDELINKQNKYKMTPLMNVCFRGYLTKGKAKDADTDRLKIVKKLLESGAKAEYVTADTKMTATHWAAFNKDAMVVKELLMNNAPHNKFSHMGRLPIDVGGSSRAFDVVDICLEAYFEQVNGGPPEPLQNSMELLPGDKDNGSMFPPINKRNRTMEDELPRKRIDSEKHEANNYHEPYDGYSPLQGQT